MPEVKVRFLEAQLEAATLRVPYWDVDSAADGLTLLVVAAQHGNEVQGSEALRRFVSLAGQELQRGRITAVPFCNIPALRERHHHEHQGPEEPVACQPERNMNLTWPGDPSGNDTARLAHVIYTRLGADATHAVDIHCWTGFWAAACLPREDCPRSMELAAISALPFARKSTSARPGARPTLLGALFTDSGRASLTLELAGQYALCEQQVRLGVRCLANIARFLQMTPGRPEGTDEGPTWRDEAEVVDVTASRAGLFVAAALDPGDWVQEGQPLGHLLRDDDLTTVAVHAPATGRLEAYGCHRENCDVSLAAMHPYASRGDLLARIIVPR